MKINKTIAIVVVLLGLFVGSLGAGLFLSQRPVSVNAASPALQDPTCTDDDDIEHEADNEEDDDTEENEENEACDDDVGETGDVKDDDGDEAVVSPNEDSITADEAKAAAEGAYPGTKALEVELENENGAIAYEVELDNGLEVIVDPANGSILGTDAD